MKPTFYDPTGEEKLALNFNSIDTNWASFTPVINGATTNPTKGTTRVEKCFWRRDGSDLLISFYYSQTTAGTAGSGTYLFQLPAGLTMDTSIIQIGNDTTATTRPGVVGHGINSASFGQGICEVKAFNSTALALFQVSDSNSGTENFFVGSGAMAMSNAPLSFRFKARVPILGWSVNDAVLAEGTPATQSEISNEISNGKIISPDKARFIPGVAKAWVNFSANGVINKSYNISSIVHNGTGDYTINFTQPFSDTNYSMVGSSSFYNGSAPCFVAVTDLTAKSTTSIRVLTYRADTLHTIFDADETSLAFFGEQ